MSNAIPEKMLAVTAYGPKDYRVEEKTTPRAKPGEVIIKVKACGICGSDVHAYHGAVADWGDENTPPWMIAPVTPGHEFWGEVVELGEGAAEKYDLEIGDRTISEQIIPCWECRYCKEGLHHLCNVHNIYGFQSKVAEGAMAEYMRYPVGALVYKIPEELSLEEAAAIEPLACASHAVERGDISLKDTVVIAGAGPIGLFAIQAAALKNPYKLVVIDINNERLKLAKKLGADIVLNPIEVNVKDEINNMTEGYGCDVFIEVTGNPNVVKTGLDILRKRGRFVEFSVFSGETTVDWTVIGEKKELSIIGGHLSPKMYPVAIELLAKKKVTVDGIVTHKFPLRDFTDALKQAENGTESIKVLLIP